MVRRTARAPSRCPAMRGNRRAAAHRPLPSMMMATGTGGGPSAPGWSRPAAVGWVVVDIRVRSDLADVLFLIREAVVDLFYVLVGEFLHLVGPGLGEILANFVLFLVSLDLLHAVAAYRAHRNFRALGVFVRHLGQLIAPFG